MSQPTANSIMPIIHCLSKDQQEELLQQLEKIVKPKQTKKPRKKRASVYDNLDPIFWPENHEVLVADIMHGK